MKSIIRTRFAPSPTGFLHVGGVRTALFAWLVARQAGGQFVLRIEDTDQAREVSGSANHIMDSLKWLGIDWDEGPDGKGKFGPYYQSQRLQSYKEWAGKLVEKGLAYADPYTPQELDEFRQQAITQKRPFLFRNYRPANPLTWDGSQPLRLKSSPKDYDWHDEVMGDLKAGPEVIDDFILMKSDGFPTYNFAHIIDDHLMQITHVIRSQEFLSSVPKYLNLYDALEFERPVFATLPFVMGPDGKKKLSKRDGAKDILDYSREGYLPSALLNFLATLGWNDGTEQEIFSVDELLEKFSLSRVQKSGALFDEKRLIWIDGMHIRKMDLEQLGELSQNFWPPSAKNADEKYKKSVLLLVQERLKYLAELPQLTNFFFETPTVTQDQLVDSKMDSQTAKGYLSSALDKLAVNHFRVSSLETSLRELCQEQNTSPGVLFSLIRKAVTGSNIAPGLFETLSLLGKETSVSRLQTAIKVL